MLRNTRNLIGVFCSNKGSVDGLLAATDDGTDLDRAKGESVSEIIDTGCKFYNAGNMDQADIAQLLYD